MTDLALPALFAAVKAAFIENKSPVPNEFGWRVPTNQTRSTTGRIAWTPGDPQGKAGLLTSAVKPNRLPARPIATLGEIFQVFIYGADIDDPGDELAQYTAARTLFDFWYLQLYNAGYKIGSGGRILLTDLSWVVDKKQRPHGACLRATMTIQAAIFDEPFALVPTTTNAELDTGLSVDGAVITSDDGEVDIDPDPSTAEEL